MLLRLVVCIGMDVFCIWQGFAAAAVPAENGRHYFPGVYIFCVILLTSGLNKFGLMTWRSYAAFIAARSLDSRVDTTRSCRIHCLGQQDARPKERTRGEGRHNKMNARCRCWSAEA